ncbi:MAG: hypothetical protein GY765_08410 [bacterium]|nr:hypothetical protein [bacterium]
MGKIKIILLSLLFAVLSLSPFLHALDPETAIGDYLVDEWKAWHDFPSDSAFSMGQSSDGYLWFATPHGLYNYEGLNFRQVDITISQRPQPNIFFSKLYIANEDRIFLGTLEGVYLYHKGTLTLQQCHDITEVEMCYFFQDSTGNVWASQNLVGLYQIKNNRMVLSELPGVVKAKPIRIKDIAEDNLGMIWVLTGDQGLFYGQNGAFFRYDNLNALAPNAGLFSALCIDS